MTIAPNRPARVRYAAADPRMLAIDESLNAQIDAIEERLKDPQGWRQELEAERSRLLDLARTLEA